MSTPIFNIHDAVLLAGVMLCLVNIVLLAKVVHGSRLASRALQSFFTMIALSQLGLMLIWSRHIAVPEGVASLSVLALVGVSLILKGPLIWLYICALTQQPIKRPLLLVGMPVVLSLTILLLSGLSATELTWRSGSSVYGKQVFALWLLIKIIPVTYGCLALWQLRRLQPSLERMFANDIQDGPRWLYLLVGGFCLKWLYDLITHLLLDYPGPDLSNLLGLVSKYTVFVLVALLFSYLVSDANRMIIKASAPPAEELESATSKPEQDILARIKKIMEEEHHYLKNNINVERFANAVGASEKQVSALINHHYQQNFFEFINQRRIEEAKRLLREAPHMSIAEIYAASGFNSKSAFQRFFKRFTNKTPSEYRQKHLR